MKTEVLICVKPADRDACLAYFNQDMGYFIALMKLMAPTRSNFDDVVSKFIVYSQVN